MSTDQAVANLESQIEATQGLIRFHESEVRVLQSALVDLVSDLAAVRRAATVMDALVRQDRMESQCP